MKEETLYPDYESFISQPQRGLRYLQNELAMMENEALRVKAEEATTVELGAAEIRKAEKCNADAIRGEHQTRKEERMRSSTGKIQKD